MSPFDDDRDVQESRDESVLTGRPVSDDPALLDVVAALRSMAQEPAPEPTAALAALLRDGLAPRAIVAATPPEAGPPADVVPLASRRRRRARVAAALVLTAKIALGAGAAVAVVGGAATVDAVPDGLQRPAAALVASVRELLTFGPAGDGTDTGGHTPGVTDPAGSGVGEPAPARRVGEHGQDVDRATPGPGSQGDGGQGDGGQGGTDQGGTDQGDGDEPGAGTEGEGGTGPGVGSGDQPGSGAGEPGADQAGETSGTDQGGPDQDSGTSGADPGGAEQGGTDQGGAAPSPGAAAGQRP